ncbi:MAG: VWA domain-containing protein [Bacteroidales bacterium]|nr:VWA domain-containing protein [Bacteroidales bacterium]
MENFEFTRPEFLWLLIIIAPMIAWYIWKNKNNSAKYQLSNLNAFEKSPLPAVYYFRHILFFLRILSVILLIVALARPKVIIENSTSTTEGISISMAIDISSSMLAQDFDPNRLEVAKDEAINFISGRPNDRVAVVAFAGESFTQCPLTTDHVTAINLLQDLETGIIEDGTAIGLGLANAITRLKDDDAKSKVVILLTDGVNNSGSIAPLTAADMAASIGIRVYTIGIGNNGTAPFPVQTPFGIQYQQMEVQIDENMLQQIADKTGGAYFRATDGEKLSEIYQEIDKLEKTIFSKEENKQYKDYFMPFLIFALLLIVIEIALSNTILKTNP